MSLPNLPELTPVDKLLVHRLNGVVPDEGIDCNKFAAVRDNIVLDVVDVRTWPAFDWEPDIQWLRLDDDQDVAVDYIFDPETETFYPPN